MNIKIGYDTSLHIPDAPFQQSYNFTQSGQYKDYDNTYKNVGYFRGETYPFAIVFVFNDGTESVAIPCAGVDDFNPGLPVRPNPNGIYRFPANAYAPFSTTTSQSPGNSGSSNLNVMGVTFDWTLAGPIPTGIVGWYFVRGERKQNLIYQGIVIPTAKAIPMQCTNCFMPVISNPVTGLFPNPSQSITQERRLMHKLIPRNLFTAPPHIQDHLHDIFDVALRVHPPGNGEPHQVHLRMLAEHQRTNFDRSDASLENKLHR